MNNPEPKHTYDIPDFYGEPDPEDFLPSPKPPITRIYHPPKLSSFLPAAAFLTIAFCISYIAWQNNSMNQVSVSYHTFFEQKEYWRALTALFAHSDLGHFLNNAWLFALFAWFLRDFAGIFAFPIFSILIGVIANVITIMTMPQHTQLVGASGMVYGMVAFWIVYYMKYAKLSFNTKLLRAAGVVVLLLFPTTYQPEVSYMAHAVGFGVGLNVGTGFAMTTGKDLEV